MTGEKDAPAGRAAATQTKKYEPRILAFLCNWCSYAGADLAGVGRLQLPPTFRVVRVMCSSRVDPLFVLRAYLRGADGILLGGCHPGDCHYQRGNYFARRRFAMVKKMLQELGLEPERLRLSWVSASEGQRFRQVVTEFTEHLRKLGPSEARTKLFC
jgi:F420-non-reducing hydrogenase iron-sulfur subunit